MWALEKVLSSKQLNGWLNGQEAQTEFPNCTLLQETPGEERGGGEGGRNLKAAVTNMLPFNATGALHRQQRKGTCGLTTLKHNAF